MRNTTNILIANMAIADLWITIDIPYVIKWLFVGDTWFSGGFGSFLCKFFHSAQAGSIACSIFTLVCVSLDRSLAIIFPMRVILTKKAVKVLIAIVWLLTLAFIVPLFAATVVYPKGDGLYKCEEDGWVDITILSKQQYIQTYIFCTYILPLTIIICLYVMTAIRLWSRKVPGHRSLRVHKRVYSSNKRATIMLVTVVVVFAICWFPLQVLEFIKVYDEDLIKRIPLRLSVVMPWFGFANSAINPVLYVIFSENYRREFKRTFTRMSRRRSSTSVVSRGLTMRTRMSLSTSVPLQKLRNDSLLHGDCMSNGLVPSTGGRRQSDYSPIKKIVETPDSVENVFGSSEQNEDEHCLSKN